MAVGQGESQDHDAFLGSILTTVTSLREQTAALLALVNEQHESSNSQGKSATATPEVLKGQHAIADQVTALRTHNRRLAHLVRETKATTGKSRSEVDRLHLGLQNLYYEQRHLEGEISGCEEYPHPYTQLPLISEEEFITKYPEWTERRIQQGDDNGERGLMRARILDEKQERENLEAKRMDLVKKKAELVKENSKRKDDLGNLDKQLETFIEAAKPIQKTFKKEL